MVVGREFRKGRLFLSDSHLDADQSYPRHFQQLEAITEALNVCLAIGAGEIADRDVDNFET